MDKEKLQILNKLKILLVDDDRNVRSSLSDMLKELSKDVLEAEDGVSAWKKYSLHQPDIMIVDIQMPKENGLEFIKKVREVDCDTPIVILSAFSEIEFFKQAIPLRLEEYIAKPISFKAIMNILEKCVDNYRKKIDVKFYFPNGAYYVQFQQTIIYNNLQYNLGFLENRLFTLLFKKRNQIVSTKEIENFVWCDGDFTENALKSLLQKLRKKLGKNTIQTLRNIGYKLIVNEN